MELNMKLHEGITVAIESHLSRIKNKKSTPAIFYLIAQPGVGKSEGFKSFCNKYNIGFLGTEPGLVPEEKFSGIPDIIKNISDDTYCEQSKIPVKEFDKDKQEFKVVGEATVNNQYKNYSIATKWSRPELVEDLFELSKTSKNGVICLLDDFHLCPPEIQKYMFEMETHRSISGHKIPDNVTFVLAGNNSAMAGAKVQFSAVRNRTIIINVVPDIDQWVNEFAIPNNVNHHVVEFLQNKSNSCYFCSEESTTEQFASPRSWTKGVSHVLDLCEKNEFVNKILVGPREDCIGLAATVEGSVGPKAANAFMNYYKFYRKINLKQLFDDGIVKISKGSEMETYIYSVAITNEFFNRYINNITDKEKLKNVINNFSKAIIEIKKTNEEYVSMITNMLLRKDPISINNTKIDGRVMIRDISRDAIPLDILRDLAEKIKAVG